jgi:hypothetical protein
MIFGQRELSNKIKKGKYRRRNFLIGPETLMGTTWRERYIWVQTGESMWQKTVGKGHLTKMLHMAATNTRGKP